MTRSLVVLRDLAVSVLRKYESAPSSERTEILREVAGVLVEAREHFYVADGSVDWRGRTYAYRQFAGEVISGANLPPEEVHSIQAAIRYHVGNILRERLDPAELEANGLQPSSPRTRSVEKRTRQSEILQRLSGGAAFEDADSVALALSTVESILSRIPEAAVRGLKAADRRKLHAAAEQVVTGAQAVVAAAGAPTRSPK